MNKYEFIKTNEECHKMTFPCISISAIISGMLAMNTCGDDSKEIRIGKKLFQELSMKGKSNMHGIDFNSYASMIENKRIAGVPIVIDDDIDEHIIILNGFKNDGMSVIKIYIGE